MFTYEKDGFIYNLSNNEIIIDKYVGKETDVIVPSEIDGTKVVKISIQTFSKNKNIKSIVIPETVTEIWEFAFRGCSSLRKIKLPKTLKLLERGAFELCTSLETIKLDKDNEMYKSIDGVIYTANGSTLVAYPANKAGESYDVISGTEIIESYAFCNNQNLKTVNLPESVKTIGGWGFFRSKSLEKINICSSMKKIGVFSFSECKKLKEFHIPEGINALESSIFYDCPSLHLLSCPKGFKGAGKHTLFNCPIDTLYVHKGTKPMDVIPDAVGEFNLFITYDDGRTIEVLFNRTYFYSRLKIESDGSLDFKKYDNFFTQATKLMTPEESKNIALSRIKSDFPPSSDSANNYISYLKSKAKISEEYFKKVDITSKNAKLISRLASELGYSSQAARILEYSSESVKKYEL